MMFNFVCYSVKNRGKQSLFLNSFFKMGGEALGKILLLPDIAAPRHSKKRPCFLEAILQHLKKEGITCQEGRYEARRIIRFE